MLETYDRAIDALEHQAARVRRSAASLLALRADLIRAVTTTRSRREVLVARKMDANAQGASSLARTLSRDAEELEGHVSVALAQQARVEEEVRLLLASAASLQQELEALRRERADAAVILQAGHALTTTSGEARRLPVTQLLALDAARDEIARVEALLALWKEEQGSAPEPGRPPSS